MESKKREESEKERTLSTCLMNESRLIAKIKDWLVASRRKRWKMFTPEVVLSAKITLLLSTFLFYFIFFIKKRKKKKIILSCPSIYNIYFFIYFFLFQLGIDKGEFPYQLKDKQSVMNFHCNNNYLRVWTF